MDTDLQRSTRTILNPNDSAWLGAFEAVEADGTAQE